MQQCEETTPVNYPCDGKPVRTDPETPPRETSIHCLAVIPDFGRTDLSFELNIHRWCFFEFVKGGDESPWVRLDCSLKCWLQSHMDRAFHVLYLCRSTNPKLSPLDVALQFRILARLYGHERTRIDECKQWASSCPNVELDSATFRGKFNLRCRFLEETQLRKLYLHTSHYYDSAVVEKMMAPKLGV